MMLAGKTIVVGVTGGIAAYKAAEVVRLLVQKGAAVRVIMTAGACQFITPLTLQTLSNHPVSTSLFDLTQESEIGHIRLADGADAVLVAPATANLVGKLAHGLADDLLSTVLLATRAPLLVAPAMNVHMFENAAVQGNLQLIAERGARVIAPAVGSLACGYEGAGRLPDPAVLVEEVARAVSAADFAGQRVLVTAGPNREPLDPVRFISNRSTGRMGYALAAAAWRRGAEVTLVSGPTSLPDPHGVRTLRVGTAAEMHRAVRAEARGASVLLMAAAVADYRPAKVAPQKIKKGQGGRSIELERTVDILGDLPPSRRRLVVGFAAETEDVVENAQRKLREKRLDLVVANDVSRGDAGFEVETNAVTLIDAAGSQEIDLASKEEVAERILDRVSELRGARPRSVAHRRVGRRGAT
jgi:phosphopantothenoylcysteine decarboxylase / phosphopantothenate---cysteine ligase